jgi:hypothetical protein
MCKEMLVIPVNRVVDMKKWRSEEEEERHKRSLTKKEEENQCNRGQPLNLLVTSEDSPFFPTCLLWPAPPLIHRLQWPYIGLAKLIRFLCLGLFKRDFESTEKLVPANMTKQKNRQISRA